MLLAYNFTESNTLPWMFFTFFFNCTNGTKSRNVLQMDSISRVTRNWDIFFLSLYLIPTIDAKTCNRELKLFLDK